ncbi:MAG: TonB-dependent receptor [Bacteroidales bacterium]|nr:TonB-dependent receptor [Bacteroidales bacterium]
MRQFLFLLAVLLSAFSPEYILASIIRGRALESETNEPAVGAVAILLTADSIAAGSAATDGNGDFSITVARNGIYTLKVQMVGCETYIRDGIACGANDTVNLETLFLRSLDLGLDEVVVTAQRGKIIYKLDRQKINAQSVLTASTGTAADVLRSMPSVRVDSDGEIYFRGSSGFLVYVDGKKSMLDGTQALEQIPAAMIEDVEIITTPSARYRTDGDAGIINITTRRQTQRGFSASALAGESTMNAYDFDLNLAYVAGRNRWYVGGIANRLKNESDFNQTKTTLVDGYLTTSKADGTRYTAPANYIAIAGWEIDCTGHRLNVETQYGMTRTERGGHMSYNEHREFDNEIINDNIYDAHDVIRNTKHLAQISTDYTWTLNGRGDRINVNGRLRYDWDCLEYTESNLFDATGTRYEGTRGYEDEHHWDFDGTISYRLNYHSDGHLETGYQYVSYSEHGDYSIKYWDRALTDFVWQDDLYAPFFYRRQIHSLYAMVNQKAGPVEIDAGLRGDHTIDELTIDVAGADRYIKRWNLFPSAHLIYRIADKGNLMGGYSYRTVRPGIWQLEPYITYEDYYTKLIGNPDIRPSYVHSAEIGYNHNFGNDNSITATAFWRSRSDVAERVRVPYEPGVTLDSLVNAGDDRTVGMELSSRLRFASWWTANVNGSLFGYTFIGKYDGCTSASNFSYSVAMINNFTIGSTTKLQFDANLIGPTVLSQGREKAYCYFDLAVRQQLIKNILSASLVVHNLFHTARYSSSRVAAGLESYTVVKPRFPNIALTLAFNFNSRSKEKQGAVSGGAQFTGSDF